MSKNPNLIKWAYFGGGDLSVIVLKELLEKGFRPSLIITTPDKPKGRKLILTAPEIKNLAEKENIPYIQPESLKNFDLEEIKKYFNEEIDVFVVVSYGKIIPKNILDLPLHKTLNVHPSLLPKLRGPSPIKSAILSENKTGVTIIRLDEEIDHGPIIFQQKIENIDWPPYEKTLEEVLGKLSGKILVSLLPKWINNEIKETDQDHQNATFTKKINKQDAELNLKDSPEINLRKIRAFSRWPGAYFFEEENGQQKRIIVREAKTHNEELIIERVVPEGKKEMNYADYLRGKSK